MMYFSLTIQTQEPGLRRCIWLFYGPNYTIVQLITVHRLKKKYRAMFSHTFSNRIDCSPVLQEIRQGCPENQKNCILLPKLFTPTAKLYIPSTLNIDLILWHTIRPHLHERGAIIGAVYHVSGALYQPDASTPLCAGKCQIMV